MGLIGEISGKASKLREQMISSAYDVSINFEFIALSLSGDTFWDSDKDLASKNYRDMDGKVLEGLPVVNVLMID